MHLNIIVTFLFSLICSLASAQSYVCKTNYICPEDSSENKTLSLEYYSDQGLLLKRTDYNPHQPDNPSVSTYKYDENNLLISFSYISIFQKIFKYYTYENKKIKEILWIRSSLSTENIVSPHSFPLDSNSANQPKIFYVWNTDTIKQKYHYNGKGLLIKIANLQTGELNESSEIFEYDKLNRLVRSFSSDQYMYRYFYDSTSKLITKHKYQNIYVDNSGIGPLRKTEHERLKKAVWELAFQEYLKYDVQGRLIENHITGKAPGSKELFSYDKKGRLIESKKIEGENEEELCKTIYKYE